jgi:hypothetical protein
LSLIRPFSSWRRAVGGFCSIMPRWQIADVAVFLAGWDPFRLGLPDSIAALAIPRGLRFLFQVEFLFFLHLFG